METKINEYVFLVFDECGSVGTYIDIRACESNTTVATMYIPGNYDFLTAFNCQASVLEDQLIEYFGDEKSYKIMVDIQNYITKELIK